MELLTKIGMAFQHGGIWMWPILLIQLISIAIVVERFFALYSKRKMNQTALAETFEENIRRGEMDVLIDKAQKIAGTNAIAKATVAGAKAAKFFGGKEEIQGKMDEVLLHENSQLDRRVGFLSMLGNVATLTGLLGTITGMIQSFAAVANANPSEKAQLLAAGISEAMNCTAYGLIAAIPALVAFAVLQNRSNQLAEDLNGGALKVFNWLSFAYEPVGFKNTKGSVAHSHSPEANA